MGVAIDRQNLQAHLEGKRESGRAGGPIGAMPHPLPQDLSALRQDQPTRGFISGEIPKGPPALQVGALVQLGLHTLSFVMYTR